MHLHDVRMLEVGDDAGFRQIKLRIMHQMWMRHLNRHETVENLVSAAINYSKSPSAQTIVDFIAANLGRSVVGIECFDGRLL